MIDFGIDCVTKYEAICQHGRLWRVEFRDFSDILVIEDPVDSPEANYIIEPIEGFIS